MLPLQQNRGVEAQRQWGTGQRNRAYHRGLYFNPEPIHVNERIHGAVQDSNRPDRSADDAQAREYHPEKK